MNSLLRPYDHTWPISISYTRTPKDHQSAAESYFHPFKIWNIYKRTQVNFNRTVPTPLQPLFFRPRLNSLIFLPTLSWKYYCIIILKLWLMTFRNPFWNVWGSINYSYTVQLKTYSCSAHIFQTKLNPIQNISLGFILKTFLKFRKFLPWYCYKKKCVKWKI